MKIKEITYLLPPSDLDNDCLDVFVTLEDDYCTDEFSYLVEVATPQYLSTIMERFESDFLPPGYPYIIVSKLTDKIIRAAIQAFKELQDNQLIQNQLQLITKSGKIQETDKLIPLRIG